MTQDADTSGYAGQQSTTDGGSEINAMSFVVDQCLGRIATVRLVKVMAVSNNGDISPVGTVDVMPLVNQIDGLGNSEPHITIYDIPYLRVQGGKNAIIMDPVVGDIGICGFADRDSSVAKSTKAQANPGSYRRFDLADGFYFGGFLNDTPEQYIDFTDSGIKMADKNGNLMEMKLGGIFFTGNVVINNNLQLGGALESVIGGTYGGDIHVGGDVVAKAGTGASVTLSTHTHKQGNDSHGDVEVPTNSPTGGT